MTKNSYPALLLRLSTGGMSSDLLKDLEAGLFSRRTILRALESAGKQDVSALRHWCKTKGLLKGLSRRRKEVGDVQRLKCFQQGPRRVVTVNVGPLFDVGEEIGHVDVRWEHGAIVVKRAS